METPVILGGQRKYDARLTLITGGFEEIRRKEKTRNSS
jgi:hypothetical protein